MTARRLCSEAPRPHSLRIRQRPKLLHSSQWAISAGSGDITTTNHQRALMQPGNHDVSLAPVDETGCGDVC